MSVKPCYTMFQPPDPARAFRLTERNVSIPTVKILQPSHEEIKKKKRATLVCVATNFYPDHVEVKWYINNELVEETRAKTDDFALKGKDKLYSITSRLRLTTKEWQSIKNTFKCSVEFFNENITTPYEASTKGASACGQTLEDLAKGAHTAQFSYILFLGKSIVFALFLMIFALKLKDSSGKKASS